MQAHGPSIREREREREARILFAVAGRADFYNNIRRSDVTGILDIKDNDAAVAVQQK